MEIIDIIDRLDESMGILKPYLCIAEDGRQYFVKGKNAEIKGLIKGLIKEWIRNLTQQDVKLKPQYSRATTPNNRCYMLDYNRVFSTGYDVQSNYLA